VTHPPVHGCSYSGNLCLFYRGPLSQWWYSPFEEDGVQYNCAEQYMMAKKAELFGDHLAQTAILETTGPFSSQKDWNRYPRRQQLLGRAVKNYSQETWERNRLELVTAGNLAKFRQNPELVDLLRSTGSLILAEASPIDRVWGIGLGQDNPAAFEPANWQGLNLLGRALMRTRNQL
jgi:ribA/ribD-fused uncharacterized protein